MQNQLHTAVSQFAKMPLPTAKPFATKDLEVSQQPNFSLHTPTHTGENFELAQNIDTKKVATFIKIIHSLHPNFIVSFTANTYLQTHFTNCKTEQLNLFLDLVQSFVVLHHNSRRTTVENVLIAFDSDYIQAFALWQKCQPKKQQPIYLPTLQKVLQLVQYHFENNTFTAQQIAIQLNYNTDYINIILQQLIQQNKVALVTEISSQHNRFFKLLK